MHVRSEPSGKLNPFINDKNTVLSPLKNAWKFSQNFQEIPSTLPVIMSRFATPNGIDRIVDASIPIIIEPLTL